MTRPMPSAWQQYKALLAQGLQVEKASSERWVSPLLFAGTMILLFAFAFGRIEKQFLAQAYIAATFLTAFFSLQIAFSRILEPDMQDRVCLLYTSWCLPCQQLMKPLKALEERYRNRYTDFVYVFAHDTEADAQGFAKFHKIASRAYLGSAKLLEGFHQPELPSYYASDRYGWLLDRKLNVQEKDLAELERILDFHTVF